MYLAALWDVQIEGLCGCGSPTSSNLLVDKVDTDFCWKI